MFHINTIYNKDLMTDTVVVEFKNGEQHLISQVNLNKDNLEFEEFLEIVEGMVNKVAEQVH